MDAFRLTDYYWNEIKLHRGRFIEKNDGYLAARASFSVRSGMLLRYHQSNKFRGDLHRLDKNGFWNETEMLYCLRAINEIRIGDGALERVLKRLGGDISIDLKRIHGGRAFFKVDEIHEA